MSSPEGAKQDAEHHNRLTLAAPGGHQAAYQALSAAVARGLVHHKDLTFGQFTSGADPTISSP